MEKMDASHGDVDAKFAGIKRKAETAWSRCTKKQAKRVLQIESGVGKLPVHGCFLKLQEILDICRQSDYVLESVPPGKKINVFCIIDDSDNALKREKNEAAHYPNDIEAWKSNEGLRTFYVQRNNGNLRVMKMKGNLYYKDSHVKGRADLPPLKPQPHPNTIIKVCRRLYTSSRSSYRRRITALSGYGIKSVAVVEYSDSASSEHVFEGDKKVLHNTEKSTNIGVTSKHVLGTKKKVVQNAENNAKIPLSSQQVPETNEVICNVEKTANTAVKSKHVPETKKKVVHNVVKRPRGRPRLNRDRSTVKRSRGRPRLNRDHNGVKRPRGRPRLSGDNIVKRPRGRPRLNRVDNVVERPRGGPPHIIKHDVSTDYHMVNKVHTQLSMGKCLTSETSKTNGKAAFETDEELLGSDKWFGRSSNQAPHIPFHTTTGMEKKTTVYEEDFLMLGMLEENPSVQEVISRKSKPPCIILYSDQQFSEMKRNLECESVLGLDCTHKFGDCYVTMTVYQNSRALHKDTNEPLLFLGPVFLHWDKEFLTYVVFFTHIMNKLEGIEPDIEVRLGNNAGLPLFKALKLSFPTSSYILDYNHLKKTVREDFLSVVPGKPKSCVAILDRVFGEDGIINSSCLSDFEDEIFDLACYFAEFPFLKSYFDGLKLVLYPYVCEPHQKGISQKCWVNGNDDVLNNQVHKLLKYERIRSLEIVEKMCAISSMQMLMLSDV